jgi:hypothetical protein
VDRDLPDPPHVIFLQPAHHALPNVVDPGCLPPAVQEFVRIMKKTALF